MLAGRVLLGLGRFLSALLKELPHHPSLVRMGVFDQAVDFSAFMVFWQILCDRQTCLIYEE